RPKGWQRLYERRSWQYRFRAAPRNPATTSGPILRRRAAGQLDEEAASAFGAALNQPERGIAHHATRPAQHAPRNGEHQSASDIGSAHHAFLERVSLERVGSLAELTAEARRLLEEGALTEEAMALLDFDG